MGMFGAQQKPGNLPLAPAASHPPGLGSSEITLAGIEARQRAAKAEGMGLDDTVKTSPEGLRQPSGKTQQTLLG